MSDPVLQFIDFLQSNGIPPAVSGEIIPDDRIRRYTVEGDRPGSKNAVYRLAIEGDFGFGWVKSHKHSDRALTFSTKNRQEMSAAERQAFAQKLEQRKRDAVKARVETRMEAAQRARTLWLSAKPFDKPHPYVVRKKICGDKLRGVDGKIILPMVTIDHQIWNAQTIDRQGRKKFMYGGRTKGCYFPIGKKPMMSAKPFIFCEGYSTGQTLYDALGCPVVCCMTAGNLAYVAADFRRQYRFSSFVFAADFDRWTMLPEYFDQAGFPDGGPKELPGDDPRWVEWRQKGWLYNTGGDRAEKAAALVGGDVVEMPQDVYIRHKAKPTDFNDMMLLDGHDAVRRRFAHVI